MRTTSQRRSAFLTAFALLALWGCGSDGTSDAASRVTVSDSVGIRMVENAGSGEAPSGRLERLWQYGFEPGEYTFQTVRLGALREDGSAVVGDMGNREVVAVDAAGERHTVLARTGQGPSEVSLPRLVVSAGGGGVWVEDMRNAKLLLFEGDSLATVVSTRAIPDVARGLMPQGVDAEGRLLMTTDGYDPEFEEPWFHGSMVRFEPGSSVADTVGVFPLAPRRSDAERSPFVAYGVVAAAGGGFIHGRTDQAEIIWRSAGGDVVQIARWDQEPAFPTDALWAGFEAYLCSELRRVNPQMGGQQLDDFVDQQVARYEVDASAPLPLFGPVYGAADGSVWMAEFTPGSSPTRYRVLAPDGTWRGTMAFPGPFQLLSVRDGLVLGVETDELDVPGIVLYRHDFGR